MIAEVNWDVFAAKFSTNKQNSFERLCYLLFCKEFQKPTGIFRFRNHAGIETNPVQSGEQIIGWQAKFYGTTLAENEGEFLSSIDKAKRDYPETTKIIFYTNQEFGQGKKANDPIYKTRIEDHAKIKAIEIEWRTASYFESPFVCEENFSIAQHYFSQKKGILDAINSLADQTNAVLKQIRSNIVFGDKLIKLNRSETVISLVDELRKNSLLIVSGSAGVGKTAVLKDFYERETADTPIFVFKPAQFSNIHSVDQLLQTFGELNFVDFVNEHKDVPIKYAVIDSAERLSDIEDLQVFQEFLSALIKAGWKVIFTVRYSYVDDLKFQLREFHNAGFQSMNIPGLSDTELGQLAEDNAFRLPKNDRVCQLIQTPLYLREYLYSYQEIDGEISYVDFRELIWRNQIQNSTYRTNNIHMRREQSFLQVVKDRAASGTFFVKVDSYDQEAISKLSQAGIIECESTMGGYFITHDAYEEWALEKIIDRAFHDASSFQDFYKEIGSTLPIRRAFRNWLSDKLSTSDDAIQKLIEFTVNAANVECHWKDEALVAAMLSDYSTTFFDTFKRQLLTLPPHQVITKPRRRSASTDNGVQKSTLLYRLLFLLRVACKTVDESMLMLLGMNKAEQVAFRTIFTIPKGEGWSCLIAFLNKNRDELQLQYMNMILPVLNDWNSKNKTGETTRNAAQMALYYYSELTKMEDFYFGSHDETKDKLTSTIINGAKEIKAELTTIVDDIVGANDPSHTTRYYELAMACLGPLTESSDIASALPTQVMRLANFYWLNMPQEASNPFRGYQIDIEHEFGLSHRHHFPASAYQTPTLMLLKIAPHEAVKFILQFTNKAIEHFATTAYGKKEVYEIDLLLDNADVPIKQYNCFRVWSLYRGGQPAPAVLESMHMALENWLLLHLAKLATPEVIEAWCLYLLRNSRSASITAVVASLVLAMPQKLFNVAKVLFRTKEIFFIDTARVQFDISGARSLYSIGFFDPNDIFRSERMKTCDDKHRSHTLENLALNYQLFLFEGESPDVFGPRQEAIWKIFDEHYGRLPEKAKETDEDKTWQLYLARMDRRRMNISTEQKEEGLLVNFNPDMAPDLKHFSESSLARSSEAMKYLPLVNWSRSKFERKNENTGNKYDEDHQQVITEVKEILDGLANDTAKDGSFSLFYRAAPAFACAVLLRDFLENLSKEERELCKEVILLYASAPLREGYSFQFSDGSEPAIKTLPILMCLFPEDEQAIKELLLLALFLSYPAGTNDNFFDIPIAAVREIWKINPDDANAIFLGFLVLKPKFSAICEQLRSENLKSRGQYGFSYFAALTRLEETCEAELGKIAINQIRFSEVGDVEALEPEVLVRAFLLLPPGSSIVEHKQFVQASGANISRAIKNNDREERFDYQTEHRFLKAFAHFVLSASKADIESYVKPFIDDISNSKDVSDIFDQFIVTQDHLNQYEEFWMVWSLFYPRVVACYGENNHSSRTSQDILRKYLFASVPWNKSVTTWHSFKDREKTFFKRVADDLGHHPITLYSLAKLLNGIGKTFQDDGVSWIGGIIQNHAEVLADRLEKNTVYHLENFVRGYVLKNRTKIRRSIQLKSQILTILDFLLETGSAPAYMLREDIL